MGSAIDLIGQRFGRLTVRSLAPREQWPRNERGYPIRCWLVVCDCGNTRQLLTALLLHKRRPQRSCGSCIYRKRGPRKAIELTGQRFGKLVVLRLAPREMWPPDYKGRPQRSWIVQCDCGRIMGRAIPTVALRHGKRKSCGCLNGQYESGAKKSFRTFVCEYCGVKFSAPTERRYCREDCSKYAYAKRNLRACRQRSRECQRRQRHAENLLRFVAGLEKIAALGEK